MREIVPVESFFFISKAVYSEVPTLFFLGLLRKKRNKDTNVSLAPSMMALSPLRLSMPTWAATPRQPRSGDESSDEDTGGDDDEQFSVTPRQPGSEEEEFKGIKFRDFL